MKQYNFASRANFENVVKNFLLKFVKTFLLNGGEDVTLSKFQVTSHKKSFDY